MLPPIQGAVSHTLYGRRDHDSTAAPDGDVEMNETEGLPVALAEATPCDRSGLAMTPGAPAAGGTTNAPAGALASASPAQPRGALLLQICLSAALQFDADQDMDACKYHA